MYIFFLFSGNIKSLRTMACEGGTIENSNRSQGVTVDLTKTELEGLLMNPMEVLAESVEIRQNLP
jgi:hypothetical protein